MGNEPTSGTFAAAAIVPQRAFRLHASWGDYWSLTKPEVLAVSNRLNSLQTALPIPKGIDPMKARPQRGKMR